MRVFCKQWRDAKPYTRRVRWYASGQRPEQRKVDIHMKFDDECGVAHKFYGDDWQTANEDWYGFIGGVLTTELIRRTL